MDCVSADCFPRRLVSVTVSRETSTSPQSFRIFRGWSNGDVDMTWADFDPSRGFECEFVGQCGPIPIIPPPCPTDTNDDGVTNVFDLIDLLLCFGQPATAPCDTGQDINGDGTINVLDLIDLLLAFGAACP